jgi:long-chain acyl-CoA synthetase
VLRAGGIVVPMNVLLKKREVAFYLTDSEAKLLIAWDGFAEDAQAGADEAGVECILVKQGEFEKQAGEAEALTEVADADDGDTAVILYTSGTTGQPKGAELSNANLIRNAQASAGLFDLGSDAMVLGALPLFHTFGQTCGMNATFGSGGTLTLIPRFDPGKALEIIQRDKVNIFQGVPTMYGAMLHHPERDEFDVSTLKVCASGGSAMPVELMRGFEEAFHCKVLEGYGMSESSPVASFNHPDRERKPGSVGTPIEGVEMKIVDDDDHEVDQGEVGEIVIKGHNVMNRYWNRPEATEETVVDGWLHTGDMGKVDEDGYFFIVDRKKELIIRGGYNVYPREIEEVLYEHPDVREAAVLGIPHDEYGEEVAAAVALKDGGSASAEDLRAFVKDQVAAYKYPRKVWLVDELPKGPTGKILKREIEPPDEG